MCPQCYFERHASQSTEGSPGGEALAITAVMPVYHPDGQLKLVAEVELSLQQVGSFFTRLKLTPNTFAFVVDMAGVRLSLFTMHSHDDESRISAAPVKHF